MKKKKTTVKKKILSFNSCATSTANSFETSKNLIKMFTRRKSKSEHYICLFDSS